MDLVERKKRLQEAVAHIKQDIEATFAKREELVAQMNGFLGQIHLIDQLLAENIPDPTPEPPPTDNDIEAAAEAALEGAIEDE